MAEVCVLGLGYVGLPTASLLANAGCEVLGVDISTSVVAALNEGRTNLKEAGLDTVVRAAVQSRKLVAAAEPQASDIFILCVPTPTTEGHRVDLAAVESATRAILPLLRKGNLVILESTSPVGTTSNVVGRILAESDLEPGRDFDLCYCPERVLPGNTVRELATNSRIIGGYTPESAERARRMYARFCQGTMMVTDDRTAELCKLMENTYRDVNIAIANAFARIAEKAGTDVWRAIEYANLHPRVNILSPGPGVGGHCIPVDPWFLIQQFPDDTRLLRAARELNDAQGRVMLERMQATGDLPREGKLAVLGVAYKADIDDPRESPAYSIVAVAREMGLECAVHDPHVQPGTHEKLEVSDDLPACLDDAAAAILVTDHRMYRGLSAALFADHMKGRLVGDCRNWLDHAALERAGFVVVRTGIGREDEMQVGTAAAATEETHAPEIVTKRVPSPSAKR